jgi:hypothetical protein
MKKLILLFLLSFSCIYAVTNQQIMFANTLSTNSQSNTSQNIRAQPSLGSYEVTEAKMASLIQIKKQIASLQKELPVLQKQCRQSNDTNFLMTGFPTVNNSSVINMSQGGGSCEQLRQIKYAVNQLVDMYNGQLKNA